MHFNAESNNCKINVCALEKFIFYYQCMSMLLFAIDPDAISQGRLFQMRKMFTEMVEYAEDEKKR